MHTTDGELSVGNSLAAVEAGASMEQGTINFLGERLRQRQSLFR